MSKIEKVARAMAVANGHDPDKPMSGAYQVIGMGLVTAAVDQTTPAWHYYKNFANLFLEALKAAQ